MTNRALGTSYGGQLVFDAAGVPTGVTGVEQSFFKAFTCNLTNAFTGGNNIAVGIGNTAAEAAKAVVSHTGLSLAREKFGVNADLRRLMS